MAQPHACFPECEHTWYVFMAGAPGLRSCPEDRRQRGGSESQLCPTVCRAGSPNSMSLGGGVTNHSPQTCCTEPSKTRRWPSLLCKVAVPTRPASPPDQQPACDGRHLFRHLGLSLMPVGPGSEPPVDLRRLLLDLFFWEPVSRKTYQLALIFLDSLPRVLHLGTILLSLPYQTSLDIGLRTPLPSHENRRHCCVGASH